MATLTKYFVHFAKQITFALQYIIYELMYYALGGQAIIEDLFLKNKNKCDIINKSGEVAVVTGGARGIGGCLVKKLLQCEMTVIIGCRNVEAGLKTVQLIRQQGVLKGEAHVYKLDLESLAAVKEFADEISKDFSFISLLVNNAGIMFPPYNETIDGFESQWEVNYLSPFYLTHLLMPLLEKNKMSSRVVNVTSCAHVAAKPLQFDNINMKKNYIPSAAYAQSKLGQLLFTLELDRQLRESNSKVYVLAVHPGIVDTDLFNGTPLKVLCPWVLRFLCKDVDEGATTVLAPCVSPSLEEKGGIYLSNCQVISPSKMAQDVIVQNELFKYSLKTLNITTFGK